MAIFTVTKGEDNGKELVNNVTLAVVEAANAAAAVTAANALSGIPAGYFPTGSAVDIETPGTYGGGLFHTVLDNGP